MDTECEDELELAARVSRGDADSANLCYARHADRVFAFIFQLLNGARANAEEVWQDTFMTAILWIFQRQEETSYGA